MTLRNNITTYMLVLGLVFGAGCETPATKIVKDTKDEVVEVEPLSPPPQGKGFQLDEGKFVLEPASEAMYCLKMKIPAPYDGTSFVISGVESDLPIGTHHFFMAFNAEPLAAQEPCVGESPLVPFENDLENSERPDHEGLSEGKLVFGAGIGRSSYKLPPGYGLPIANGQGHFITSHHVLNTSDNALDMHGLFNVYTQPLTATPHQTNILNCDNRDIQVEPNSEAAITATCTVPYDLDLVILASHAHNYLVEFETRIYDGEKTLDEVIYTNHHWDSPNIIVLDQPISLKAGMGLTFTCHFRNDTNEPLDYGFGKYGEMCATMNSYAYPPDRTFEAPPSLGTIILDRTVPTTLIETTGIQGQFSHHRPINRRAK